MQDPIGHGKEFQKLAPGLAGPGLAETLPWKNIHHPGICLKYKFPRPHSKPTKSEPPGYRVQPSILKPALQ